MMHRPPTSAAAQPGSLRACLNYEPRELRFGTSGRRGEVTDLTQLEVYLNALAEIEYLQSLPRSEGGIARSEEFYFAYDLRPSSNRYVEEQQGRGEIAQAVERAIRDAGMHPVNLGRIPTPALACHALSRGRGSIMVTGSHIPFDRNGYKTNSARGELRKEDEQPINERVRQVRERLYSQPYAVSPFNERGLFKEGHRELAPESDEGRAAYLERYAAFFASGSLGGMRLLVYQHSAVGRDLLVEVLERLGAEVIAAGRSETFVPIDTENIDAAQLAAIQALADQAAAEHGRLDAVVSTDGDSDRPLILGVDPDTGRARFFGGDLVGMIVAEYLGADAVVVPVSCNDAIDRGSLAAITEPRTRIGSPYVIAGLEKARRKGRLARFGRTVCGWEANGGFLTGSDITRNGKVLAALPTRDAVLPILCVLLAAREKGLSLAGLFARLPRRFSRAALLTRFPRAAGLQMVRRFSPADERIREAVFSAAGTLLLDEDGNELPVSTAQAQEMEAVREALEQFFPAEMGFGRITRLNYIDGVRAVFSNGDVAHVRPSGNADELRIYAVADTQERADAIAGMGVAEPGGILRRMEKAVVQGEGRHE
jgi:phosphomannomutase